MPVRAGLAGLSQEAAGFSFVVNYDSGRVFYDVTDLRYNDTVVIRWAGWRRGDEIRNATNPTLGAISRSEAVTLATGDTISIYRELGWDYPDGMLRLPNSYHSLDTHAFAIEVVKASDNTTLATLDSMFVLAEPDRGFVRMSSSLPLIAVARFGISPELASLPLYLRINVHSWGPGPYFFTRTSLRTHLYSLRAIDSGWSDYNMRYGGTGIQKRSVTEFEETLRDEPGFVVTQQPSTRTIQFFVPSSSRAGPATVAIYDAAGTLVFLPSVNLDSSQDRRGSFEPGGSGEYFVVLFRGHRIAASRKVAITH